MKTKSIILNVFSILAVLILMGSCATSKKTTLPIDNIDELIGTWANPENNKSITGHNFGKMVYKPDKTADLYANADSDKPGYLFTSIDMKEKWMDQKGSYYYRAYFNHPGGKSYGLLKISSDGNILEMMWVMWPGGKSLEELPSEIDPTVGFTNVLSYFIWYHQ